jgi:hypothetical protein
MYTFNNLCYGVDFNNLKLYDEFDDLDFLLSDVLWNFERKTNLKLKYCDDNLVFECASWYHGGIIPSDKVISGVVGFAITSDDDNADYVNIVRSIDEPALKEEYDRVVAEELMPHIDSEIEEMNTLNDGYDYKSYISDLNKLKEVLLQYKPSLHQVEASS